MKPSSKWKWNRADTIAWANQAVRVLAPYLVVLIPVVIEKLPKDWAYATVTIYLLNRVWDALRRLTAGK